MSYPSIANREERRRRKNVKMAPFFHPSHFTPEARLMMSISEKEEKYRTNEFQESLLSGMV